MELFSPDWFVALLGIIIIDLVLAGDNAIVIGLAARNVPVHQQKKVILWGMVGAITVRVVATLIVVWLLKIPGLLLAGGAILLWIAYKLLVEERKHEIEAKDSLLAAVRTIVVADAVMGLDNVLAVAGAGHGDFLLVLLGLLISVPIIIWGSTLFLHLINKYPSIVYIGAGILALTAAKMIVGETFVAPLFANPVVKWGFIAVVVALILGAGFRVKRQRERRAEANAA